MFETIPAIYWMIIIGLPVAFLTFILFELGMLIKDSRGIVVEAKETVSKTNVLLTDVQEIVTQARATVTEVNEAIVTPIRNIGGLLSSVAGFINGLKK